LTTPHDQIVKYLVTILGDRFHAKIPRHLIKELMRLFKKAGIEPQDTDRLIYSIHGFSSGVNYRVKIARKVWAASVTAFSPKTQTDAMAYDGAIYHFVNLHNKGFVKIQVADCYKNMDENDVMLVCDIEDLLLNYKRDSFRD
jgi:hypothetical protein